MPVQRPPASSAPTRMPSCLALLARGSRDLMAINCPVSTPTLVIFVAIGGRSLPRSLGCARSRWALRLALAPPHAWTSSPPRRLVEQRASDQGQHLVTMQSTAEASEAMSRRSMRGVSRVHIHSSPNRAARAPRRRSVLAITSFSLAAPQAAAFLAFALNTQNLLLTTLSPAGSPRAPLPLPVRSPTVTGALVSTFDILIICELMGEGTGRKTS
jgi:hypothetical protein